jgi:thymidine kinase
MERRDNNLTGEIQVIFGPMFSGKSTELLRRIKRYTVASRNCLVVKYKADTRYSEENMSTHDKYGQLSLIIMQTNQANVVRKASNGIE